MTPQPIICAWCKREFTPTKIGPTGAPTCCSLKCTRTYGAKRFHDCKINRLQSELANKFHAVSRYEP